MAEGSHYLHNTMQFCKLASPGRRDEEADEEANKADEEANKASMRSQAITLAYSEKGFIYLGFKRWTLKC